MLAVRNMMLLISINYFFVIITYITKHSGSNPICGGDDIENNSNIEHYGTSSYQVVQIGTSESNQPVEANNNWMFSWRLRTSIIELQLYPSNHALTHSS